MYTILLTTMLSIGMSTTSVGEYNTLQRCTDAKIEIMKAYVGTSINVIAKCVPNK